MKTESDVLKWIINNPPRFQVGDRVRVVVGEKEFEPQHVLGVAIDCNSSTLCWSYFLWNEDAGFPSSFESQFVVSNSAEVSDG